MENNDNSCIISFEKEPSKITEACRNKSNNTDAEIQRALNHRSRRPKSVSKVIPSLANEISDHNFLKLRATQNSSWNKKVHFSCHSKDKNPIMTNATAEPVQIEESPRSNTNELSQSEAYSRSRTSERYTSSRRSDMNGSVHNDRYAISGNYKRCERERSKPRDASHSSKRAEIGDRLRANTKSQIIDRSQTCDRRGERSKRDDRSLVGDLEYKSQIGDGSHVCNCCRIVDKCDIHERFRAKGISLMGDRPITSERYQSENRSYLDEKTLESGNSLTSDNSQKLDVFQPNDLSHFNDRPSRWERSQMSEKSHASKRSEIGNKLQLAERLQIGERFQEGDKSQKDNETSDQFQFSDRSETKENSLLEETLPITQNSCIANISCTEEKSQQDERSRLTGRSDRREKCQIGDVNQFHEKTYTTDISKEMPKICYTSQVGKAASSEENLKSSDVSKANDKTEVRWLCIPGEVPWIEQHAVVPASPSEVNLARNQLFCRPAEGFGQNWFQLEVRNRASPSLLSYRGKNGKTAQYKTKHLTSKTKPKIKRQGKKLSPKLSPKTAYRSMKTSLKGSPKVLFPVKKFSPKTSPVHGEKCTPPSVAMSTRAKLRRHNGMAFNPRSRNIPNRCSLNNKPFRVECIPGHLREIAVGTGAYRQCNNSNETNFDPHGSLSAQREGNQYIKGRVVRVEGDGRCLFRSLVTCLAPELQKTRRDDFGTPLQRSEAIYETVMADTLRVLVVKLMTDNAHFYGQLERTLINADQPMPRGYSHFQERLRDMSLSSTMPGDLELNATSMALERQVLILDVNLKPIVIYGKERFPETKMVAVRFTRLGPDVGHYDAFIPDEGSVLALDCFEDVAGNEEAVRQDTLLGVGPDDLDFDVLSSLVRYDSNEGAGGSPSISCLDSKKPPFKKHGLLSQHQNHLQRKHEKRQEEQQQKGSHQQQQQEPIGHRYSQERNLKDVVKKQSYVSGSGQCKKMDWSPIPSPNPVKREDKSTSFELPIGTLVTNNNNDIKCRKKSEESESADTKIMSESVSLIDNDKDNGEKQDDPDVFDDDDDKGIVIYIRKTDENTNENRKQKCGSGRNCRGGGSSLGVINTATPKQSCSTKSRKAGGAGNSAVRCSNHRLFLSSSGWKTRKHRSQAVVKKGSKKTKYARGKAFNRKTVKKPGVGVRKRKHENSKVSSKKQRLLNRTRQIRMEKQKEPNISLTKPGTRLIRQKVVESNHYRPASQSGIVKDKEIKRVASQTNDEELFPKEAEKHLDELLKKDNPCQRDEKFPEIISQQGNHPPKHNGNAVCFVCDLPVTQARRLCTLCGRVAHIMCVPSNLAGSDDLYFVCPLCLNV